MDALTNLKTSLSPEQASSDSQPTVQDLNRLLILQRDLLEKITLNLPLKAVLDGLCLEVEKIVGSCQVFIMVLDNRGYLDLLSAPSISEENTELFNRLAPGPNAGSSGTAVFSDQPVFVINTQTDSRWGHYQKLAYSNNIGACWSYPLHESAHKAIGSISIASEYPRSPSTFDARLLESAAHIAGIAISRHLSHTNLQNSEQRLSHIASSIPGVVLQTEFDINNKPFFTYVSEGIKKLCGIESTEARKHFNPVWKRLHIDDRATIKSALQSKQHNDSLWTMECRLTDENGKIKWIHLASTPEWDEQKSLKRINSIVLDITSEKEANARLELAGIAFASTNEGIMVADKDNLIVDVNRAYCEMTGYSREELIGTSPSILSSGRHEANFFHNIEDTIKEQGFWQGELWNRRCNGAIYPQWLNINAVLNNQGELTHYVSVSADVSNIKESEAKLRHMSQHDALTDLPNRQLYKVLLDHAIEHNLEDQHTAVLMIDLDRFKHVNETMGHQAGDQLLIQVARRLRNVIADSHLLARVGGDEFAIMIENCPHQGEAERVAMRIVNALETAVDLDGHNFFTTASIGITLYPQHGFDSETLIKNADAAVHQAKDDGRNNYAFYQPEQTHVIEQWVRLEPELRRALALDQFRVFYQPQLDAVSGKISGVEALLRWQHPTDGLMPPGMFLPIIEEIGLMNQVGDWVLEQACAQAAAWKKAGYPVFRIAVNIAGQQVLNHSLVTTVTELLSKYDIDPDQLELEIVENIVMKYDDAAQPVLNELRNLGVRLALDDFGTGYSSLSYLKMLPVQKVKIDQSLVRDIPDDPNDEAIAKAIIALSHSLNLSVCAEGVETEEQKAFLRNENCDQLQGYLISRPIPAAELTLWLDQHILDHP
ncbi:sensor domain-containing phosphodiesterase [Neptunomonas qingdaonensis]|uniref:cyclic-guanylate-specific phosphodiesterase n=1 Tax=Neptunomonas qingdaonensis TaxID=1045558 RepID=A0A1I2NR21_9GAMM|nr:EAL domain-containing protein [Neptunomonas qingdaonensis]SFG05450.1 PAS domain S-box-containing protein/diguanylate cyclase (GGDEF) domain-containing protein [Neptunomonas qingdaonensis]